MMNNILMIIDTAQSFSSSDPFRPCTHEQIKHHLLEYIFFTNLKHGQIQWIYFVHVDGALGLVHMNNKAACICANLD